MNYPNKYGIPEKYADKINLLEEDKENEAEVWQAFLNATDHIPNKIIEALIEDMATATLVDFISVFINFIKNARIEYKEVLECRKFARDEINKLEVSK